MRDGQLRVTRNPRQLVQTQNMTDKFLQKAEELHINFIKEPFCKCGCQRSCKKSGKIVEETKQNPGVCRDEFVRREAQALRRM
jgi:hypothetical protein